MLQGLQGNGVVTCLFFKFCEICGDLGSKPGVDKTSFHAGIKTNQLNQHYLTKVIELSTKFQTFCLSLPQFPLVPAFVLQASQFFHFL